MKLKTKIQILLTAAAAGFAVGRISASRRSCPACCPLKTAPAAQNQPEEAAQKSTETKAEETFIPAEPVSQTPPSASTQQPEPAAEETKDGELSPQYIGNSMSKVFHKSTCRYCANTSEKYRVEFHSALEAESQGFHPCRRCLQEVRNK